METKKNIKFNLESKRKMYFATGLSISFALALSAFEWRVETIQPKETGGVIDVIEIDSELPPITGFKEKAEIKPAVFKLIKDEFEIVDNSDKSISNEVVETKEIFDPIKDIIDVPFFDDETGEDEEREFYLIPEEFPEFPGGDAAMRRYLSKSIRYPGRAKSIGIQGKVFVEFIIDKDGNVTEVKAVNSLGGGCDEEAVKVIKNMPKWKPGKQRTFPVRVKMTIPILFRLG